MIPKEIDAAQVNLNRVSDSKLARSIEEAESVEKLALVQYIDVLNFVIH